jgi:hypothetical protein
MDIRKTAEARETEQQPATQGEPRREAVKLVEMGDVSVETKGVVHGLELGYTPHN